MCTELILAIIYMLTLSIINLFLYKLLTNYLRVITNLIKIKRVFTKFTKKELKNIKLLFMLEQKQFDKKRYNISKKINCNMDFLILGKYYQQLTLIENNKLNFYFFKLLENNYLSN